MKLGTVAGLDPGYTVLDGDPAPPKKATEPPPQFSAHVRFGQTAAWIKMPLGTEVGHGPADSVRWGPKSLTQKGAAAP